MTNIEKQEVEQIISDFKSCYNEIEFLEKQIEKLYNDKNDLVERLKQIRESESHVIKDLQTKYGMEASLDLEKLEITYAKT